MNNRFNNREHMIVNDGYVKARYTGFDIRGYLKALGQKVKGMPKFLEYIGALVAEIHYRHYKNEWGRAHESNQQQDWPELDPLYAKRKAREGRGRKMLLNKGDGGGRILAAIKVNKKGLPNTSAGAIVVLGRERVEIGIMLPHYYFLHEGMYLRYRGDTIAEKRKKIPYEPSEIARKIIGLTPSENEEVIMEASKKFRRFIEDV